MNDWLQIDLPAATLAGLPAPSLRLPVRREQMPLYQELQAEGFPLILVADEFCLWLAENPGQRQACQQEGSRLLLAAGIEATMDRCLEPSLHYFRTALWLDERLQPARMNLAMNLRELGQTDEAIEQFRAVLAQGPVEEWWQANMLCAQELMAKGIYQEAWQLLEVARPVLPDSLLFWDLLAACRKQLAPRCTGCQAELPTGARFCGHCGQPATSN